MDFRAPRSTLSNLWLRGSVEDQGYARRTEKIEELLSCHAGSIGMCQPFYLDKCRNTSVHVCLCVYPILFGHICIDECVYVYMSVHIHVYVDIYIYMLQPPLPCTYPCCCLRNQPPRTCPEVSKIIVFFYGLEFLAMTTHVKTKANKEKTCHDHENLGKYNEKTQVSNYL